MVLATSYSQTRLLRIIRCLILIDPGHYLPFLCLRCTPYHAYDSMIEYVLEACVSSFFLCSTQLLSCRFLSSHAASRLHTLSALPTGVCFLLFLLLIRSHGFEAKSLASYPSLGVPRTDINLSALTEIRNVVYVLYYCYQFSLFATFLFYSWSTWSSPLLA